MKAKCGTTVMMAAILLVAGAQASVITDYFTRVGPNESLIALFTSPSTSTANIYSDLVEVIVSGTGNSLREVVNDAFYGVPSGVPLDSEYYQLNIGWDGFNLVPRAGEPHNINNFISFIEGVGPVSSPATPDYNGIDHIYHFVLNIPSNAGQLDFGVSDGIFSDNGGQYNVQVFQLQPIPEPSSMAMIGLVGGCAWFVRRKFVV